MSDFDPAPGWREVAYEEWRSDNVPSYEDQAYVRIGKEERYYFREEPMPPFPTEPDTVIRAFWGEKLNRRLIRDKMGWQNVDTGDRVDVERVTRFELLAAPAGSGIDIKAWDEQTNRVRRETVKAVADYVRGLSLTTMANKIGENFNA